MKMRILGPGCMNCKTLERRTREALDELQLQAEIEKVEDVNRIIAFGILRTPGLMINEKIVSQGSVLTIARIKELILSEQEGVVHS